MQQADGSFAGMEPNVAASLRRIAEAGRRDLPIFAAGEVVKVRGGHFRVLAWGGSLLVLSGISAEEFDAANAEQQRLSARPTPKGEIPAVGPDQIIEIDEDGRVHVVTTEDT